MKKAQKQVENTKKLQEVTASTVKKVCESCGSDELLIAGRCTTCMICGWSACSL